MKTFKEFLIEAKEKHFLRGVGSYKCHGCGRSTRETGEGESSYNLCKNCMNRMGDDGNIEFDKSHQPLPKNEGVGYDSSKILTNPSKSQIAGHLNNSDFKELRYLHHNQTNKTYVADAGHYSHPEMAKAMGHSLERNWEGEATSYREGDFDAGFIHKDNIHQVTQHPKGIKGYINDTHKDMHDVRDWPRT